MKCSLLSACTILHQAANNYIVLLIYLYTKSFPARHFLGGVREHVLYLTNNVSISIIKLCNSENLRKTAYVQSVFYFVLLLLLILFLVNTGWCSLDYSIALLEISFRWTCTIQCAISNVTLFYSASAGISPPGSLETECFPSCWFTVEGKRKD